MSVYHVAGPVRLSWGGAALGVTKAGILIRTNTLWKPVTDDDHGTEPADFIMVGKASTVEAVLVDGDIAKPRLGRMLSFRDGGNWMVGRLVFNGNPADSTNLGKELVITERNSAHQWKAKYAAPLDPSELGLSSTQEQQFPIAFIIAPDENYRLFYVKPSYLV